MKDLEPIQLPDVLADRPVICLGKWTGEAKGTVTLSGISGSGPWHQTFEVDQVKHRNHGALRQLWARQRIQRLSDYDQFGQDEGRKAEVTRLGLAYNLLTAYTSFVAVDTQVRNAGGTSTTVTQPLPMPEGVSDAAIGGAVGLASGVAMKTQASAPMPMMALSEASMAPGAVAQERLDLRKVKQVPSVLRILSLSGLVGLSDPAGLRRELDARLMDPALVTALAGLPAGTVLELKVDASGRVLSVAFNTTFAGSAKAKALIGTWRLRSWKDGQAGGFKATIGATIG